MDADASSFQQQFHARWHSLRDPHVRALVWLLDAPDLLGAESPRWESKIARLPEHTAELARDWLLALDAEPELLTASLELNPFTRLGRYAEKLLAFYFSHQKQLVAHGMQVRVGKDETIGEFDFLLSDGVNLMHWEFATKFYLLCSSDPAWASVQTADYFVGPNLADTLGAKMRKILDRQLSLGQHPAAQTLLPRPVDQAQALLRGWLFYRRGEALPSQRLGMMGDQVLHRSQLQEQLRGRFQEDPMPVMVASLLRDEDVWLESERGFIVPDDWQGKAGKKLRGLTAPPA